MQMDGQTTTKLTVACHMQMHPKTQHAQATRPYGNLGHFFFFNQMQNKFSQNQFLLTTDYLLRNSDYT
jgi:hypothetical protein